MAILKTHITRAHILESIHEAKCIVKNIEYKTLFSTNHDKDLTYPRSAMKIFQAIPFIRSNAHKKLKLSNKEIAISCASHCGETKHLNVLNNWINKLTIKKTDLKCGIHNPINAQSSNKLLLSGTNPNQLHNNCAGKHLAMISGCLSNKFDINNYTNLNHPYQKLISTTLEDLNEYKIAKKQIGVDGCSAPQYAFPMENLSISLINLIKNYHSNEQYSQEIKILLNAILKYPFLTGGTNRFDTELMRITDGKIFSKGGAEGVLYFAHITKKIAGVIKIKDGNERAIPSVATTVLKKLSLINRLEQQKLSKWHNQKINNHAKLSVGRIFTTLK